MNEWGVVGVIAVLAGLAVTLVRPLIKFNSTVTELTCTVKALHEDIASLTSRNSDTHDRIFKALEKDGERLDRHEGRITRLEYGRRNGNED